MDERAEKFIKKAESFFRHKYDYKYLEKGEGFCNCFGFVSGVFEFLKNTTSKNLSLRLKIDENTRLEEIEKPMDYCFIFCKTNSIFYNHIAIYLTDYVFEFGQFGYKSSKFSEFKKTVEEMKFFYAFTKDNSNLNLTYEF